MAKARRLVLVLGDQLTRQLSSLRDLDPARDRVLMVEVAEETTYVPHHPKKIAFILSAMRHFAEALRAEGIELDYVQLDDKANSGSFTGELERWFKANQAERLVVTEPGEWRVLEMMKGWEARLGLPVEIREDDRFLCAREDFARWAKGRKQLRMEYFYREMRKREALLMQDAETPEGGRWNFDAENRKAIPENVDAPDLLTVAPDKTTRAVLDLVAARFKDHFGRLDGFDFAVRAEDAEKAFERFVETALARFGDYQDAMRWSDPWLFHARIALYLNVGLLDARAVCRRVERAYREGEAPLNAVEGFIRQILGWREYVRGIYWLKMPDYAQTNALKAERGIPAFYWSGDTDLACLAEAIGQTRDNAYAHHIQRLMVTGNFALLAGVRPREVNLWYMAVYADAFEWVELPNVQGMTLFADGGLLASKPYAASGKYIDRMSDYCGHCRFDPKKRLGPKACPLNALYWDFVARNREALSGNPRMGPVFKTLQRMDPQTVEAMRAQAQRFLDSLDYEEYAA